MAQGVGVDAGQEGPPKVQTKPLFLVVETQLRNLELVTLHPVNQPVLVGDAAGPKARQRMLQGFGFADTAERVSADFADQLVDALHHLLVVLMPVQVVLPGRVGENQPHGASSRSTPWPAFSWAAAASRRLALAGVRSRYAVSSSAL